MPNSWEKRASTDMAVATTGAVSVGDAQRPLPPLLRRCCPGSTDECKELSLVSWKWEEEQGTGAIVMRREKSTHMAR